MNDNEARAEIRRNVAQTMTQVHIYPRLAQAGMWGVDLSEAIDAVTDHLMAEGFRKGLKA